MKFWVNPTGGKVRSDAAGDGQFGAKRGERFHLGVDFEAEAGQGVVAPVDSQYRRFVRRVYATDALYTGMELETQEFLLTFFYVSPSIDHQTSVKAGQLIGLAQDINSKWGDPMINHVHFQLAIKPYGAIIKGGVWNTKVIYINPLHFIDMGV
jgi:murein DD-endopeptidase MepM/ murein hydrolase activator NlpD